MHRPYYCYILECADGTYYTGWTVNPERRVAVHNKGRGARYTRTRCPVKLVYVEELPDQKSAMKREIAIKRMKREGKSKLIGKKLRRKKIEMEDIQK
jgi:putative endonuclease